jgi:electron transfer flavoprotein alpha subunit
MKILAFAEQREGKLKKSAFEVTRAAKNIAGQLGGELVTMLIGDAVQPLAGELGPYGAGKVLVAQDPRLKAYSTTAYAALIAEAVKSEQATIVILPASQMGKDLAPRLSAKLSAGVAADCVALHAENGTIRATRPVYAGKALIDVVVKSPVAIFTLRPNVFAAAPDAGGTAAVTAMPVTIPDSEFVTHVTGTKIAEGRPDVTEASVIIAGGRGMKGPEHFGLIENLAGLFGGAVGASRAVVDAGWRPHDEQVGQTGKTVSPTLYIACGISGAVQHLAGMSSSKYIVAINKDKDAPIFQIADYGIAGDLFEVLPALTEQLRAALGK